MALLKSYDSIEAGILFTIQKYGISASTAQVMANVAMKSVTDMMQDVYEVTLEHTASIDPGAQIRDEIRDLRNELINKLIK